MDHVMEAKLQQVDERLDRVFMPVCVGKDWNRYRFWLEPGLYADLCIRAKPFGNDWFIKLVETEYIDGSGCEIEVHTFWPGYQDHDWKEGFEIINDHKEYWRKPCNRKILQSQ